jgi:hypothetical protein
MGQIPGLNYDGKGKIQNPNYSVKLDEFVYMNKWLPRFQMMGYAKVDFVDAYTVKEIPGKVGERIDLAPEKVAELKRALDDKIAGVEPVKPKTTLELENETLRETLKQQGEAIARLEAQTMRPTLITPPNISPVPFTENYHVPAKTRAKKL